MKYEIQANANDTITPHAIFAVNGPMVARTVTLAEAHFIVRAANSHEQLVAALKACVAYYNYAEFGPIAEARAALAAAETP